MPVIALPDGHIHYEESGDGPALMLMPGLAGLGAAWVNQIACFKDRFRVIAHDHRGCGRSARSDIRYSVDQMADDALRLMDALGVEKAHFVGLSTGGAMAITIAQDHPGRVLSLVLNATWAGPDPYFSRCFAMRGGILATQGWQAYMKATNLFLFPPWYVRDNDAALAAEEAAVGAANPPAAIMQSRIDAILAFDRRARLGAIAAPTLVLVARDDVVTPPYMSDELAAAIPGAELGVLETGGHLSPLTVPGAYNRALGAFLDRQLARNG